MADISRIFDPLGWLSPLTVLSKLLLQRCRLQNVNWDQTLPDNIGNDWKKWRNQLEALKHFDIRRYILMENTADIQIHVFSDASELVYAAAVYVRAQDEDGNVKVKLLSAKTRVAPVKSDSLPRLELCGALLGA